MGRAELGSTKHLSNQMKSKGLQRLRWYCQVCEKQCRDENGFKCHTQSESHVRQMLQVGQDPKKYLNDFSNQFLRDFIQLLRTAHGEKKIHVNRFYNEYIANKEHIHMNATKWKSLTELAKHLGREGICRVTEEEKGLFIAWIDNSPEALRRQDAVRKREAAEKGDEERAQRMIEEQVKRAHAKAEQEKAGSEERVTRELQREEGQKIQLSFAPKAEAKPLDDKPTTNAFSMKKNPLAAKSNPLAAKKNPLAAKAKVAIVKEPAKMSAAEKIMREEMERMDKKRQRDEQHGGGGVKRQRVEV